MSARSNTGARISDDVGSKGVGSKGVGSKGVGSKGVGSKGMAESPADLKDDQTQAEEKKILECLGAAVIMRWGTLPTKTQRELFEHATSLADLGQTAPPKGQIARFLHNHNGDGDQTPRRVVL